MSLLVANSKYIAIAKELHVDVYDYSSHKILTIPDKSKYPENDQIFDIALSTDSSHLALVTTTTKQLIVYELPLLEKHKIFNIPRSASRIRFTVDGSHILIADKSGDVLIYNITDDKSGTKLLGHLSLLLDVLQTNDEQFVISSDRDEKIRVSCYPNTYNIQTYCLGHKEFVNHIELLPHNDQYLMSTSGDACVKIWNYKEGRLLHTINTDIDISDTQLKENFIKLMDDVGIEVNNLPIVHYTVTKLNDYSSLLALTVHSYFTILIYKLEYANNKFTHKLQEKLKLDRFPASIQFHENSLYIYDDLENNITVYKWLLMDGNVPFESTNVMKVFENVNLQSETKESQFESIKILYKRKFDNVQEYQERKRQRLEKSLK